MMRPLMLALLAAGLAGCSLAPTYRVPESVAPAAAFQEAPGWKQAQPADALARGQWWKVYGDDGLNALQDKISMGNQSLQAALARLQQARAQTQFAGANRYPTVEAKAGATRARTSVNSPGFKPGAEPVGNNYSLGLDLSYELDVFGRVRNQVSAAEAGEQASTADVATLELSLRAELASDYFSLRSDDAQQQLLDRTVEEYAKALQLTENLFKGGAAASIDVAQAQAQLETARTRAADLRLHRAQTEHAIAVLLGENPSSFKLAPQALADGVTPPAIDPGLPSALLERRPDVAAAERRVAAANASIGVAKAAYFPVFSLAAAFGYDSTQTGSWLQAPSRAWSVGPLAALTLFDGGRRRAQNEQAQAAYDEQVANYRNTVLAAYRDVEDSLAALRELERQSVSQAAAAAAAGRALEQSNYRYKGGVATYLEVSVSQNAALQAQLAASAIQLRRMQASVQLVKALGGGWQA
ncbi:efflux transporter outer membrane subunit [Duganella callida]|nr:efflux transporter outer membrane subunit [Duganella callida]